MISIDIYYNGRGDSDHPPSFPLHVPPRRRHPRSTVQLPGKLAGRLQLQRRDLLLLSLKLRAKSRASLLQRSQTRKRAEKCSHSEGSLEPAHFRVLCLLLHLEGNRPLHLQQVIHYRNIMQEDRLHSSFARLLPCLERSDARSRTV